MLYDPKWNAGVYSTEKFAEWLGQQPFWKRYKYTDPTNCAAAQYLRAHGIDERERLLSPSDLERLGWQRIVLFPFFQTFGFAALRARRAALREREETHDSR